ncbi:oligosaccharide flippase family protein [Cobetia marina]|uniref:oligosaccharide flippase family protein n=1 Tax=Cobetia marina TaxID=28258 RepID=UPI00174CA03E
MSNLKSYLLGSFITGSLKSVAVIFSTVVFLPLAINEIGISNYGMISLVMMFGGFSIFVEFGFPKALTLYIGQGEYDESEMFCSSFLCFLVFVVLFVLLMSALVFFDVPVFGSNFEKDSDITIYIILIGSSILLLTGFNNILIGVLEAYLMVSHINLALSVSSIMGNVILYTMALVTSSISVLMLSPLLALSLTSLYLFILTIRNTKIAFKQPKLKIILFMLPSSFKFFKISGITSLIIPANKYLLTYLTGDSAALGIFDIAMRVAAMANSFLISLAQPLYGVFARATFKFNESVKMSCKVSILIAFLYVIGCAIYYVAGEYISDYILDHNESETLYIITSILIVGVCSTSISEPFYRALLGNANLREAFYLKLIVPFLNLVLLQIVPSHNIMKSISISYSVALFSTSVIVILYTIKNKDKFTI